MHRNGKSLGVLNKKVTQIVTLGACGDEISTRAAIRCFVSETEYRAIIKGQSYFDNDCLISTKRKLRFDELEMEREL